jgi:putative transposase
MAASSVLLTALSEGQREQAQRRLGIIRPALEDGVSQSQVARTHNVARSTVQRWVKHYRERGLTGLADTKTRSDKGKSRRLPEVAITLVEGLALQTPPRSMASIHRQVVEIAEKQGWKPPSYDRVRQIIKNLSPALKTLAQQGAAAYREEFDLLYRRESSHSNAMWQADHTPLDILILNEVGKPARPWLTVIEDDYSRAIAAFRITFQEPTALTTALALRQAIWRKEDPRWHICGIPSVFYTDHGSDFTSKHIEQVAADLGIELVFSEKGVPRGRGKIERFFRSVNELFLQDLPGYCPKGHQAEAKLELSILEQQVRTWLLEDYQHRLHSETGCPPAERWEAGGYLPRMPDSQERLDLLLLSVAKTRKVHQDGIRFQGYRYMDTLLASYVKEEVLIRYDPADLAEIHVFYQDRFLCRAICAELSGETVSLKDIEKARNTRRGEVRAGLSTRAAVVEQFLAVHQAEAPSKTAREREQSTEPVRPRLKRYIHE